MDQGAQDYQRLPGLGFERSGCISVSRVRSRLWLGRDHLLLVSGSGFGEDYRRFYYKDIQALVVSGNKKSTYFTVVCSLCISLFFILSMASDSVRAVIFLVFSFAGLLLLAINLIKGPTCTCMLYTAVSRQELPSLNRFATAKKALVLIRPRIEATQGLLAQQDIAARSGGLRP
jgi:hypothetical protein